MNNLERRKITVFAYIITFMVYVFVYQQGQKTGATNLMGYVILQIYLLMPITVLVGGYQIARKHGYFKWIYSVFFVVLGMAETYSIFGNINLFYFLILFLAGFLGTGIGTVLASRDS